MESTLYIHNQAGMAPGAHRLPPHFLKNIKIIGFLLKKSTQPRKNGSFARIIKNLPMLEDFEKKKYRYPTSPNLYMHRKKFSGFF